MALRFTFVLVHGAFTDASCWWPITLRLLGSGHHVLAPPVGMRSLTADCAYIRCIVDRLDGPVILVGHDYGAAVAGVAGSSPNVVGLIFINGYILDGGESIADVRDLFPSAEIARHLVAALFREDDDSVGTEISVDIEQFSCSSRKVSPDEEAHVLAVSQRPIALTALSTRAPHAAWRQKPTWGVVSDGDRTIHPDLQRFGCRRARARRILELDAPHFVMHTHPAKIVDLLLEAATDISSDA